jgi:rhodanese-related sulfurtransferase/DNA-directed RNA polymerase subunit RPC12/RpoP
MKQFLLLVLLLGLHPAFGQTAGVAKQAKPLYACVPCGHACDDLITTEPGTCGVCGMRRVLTSSIVFRNITPTELCQIVALRPNVILLDVRTPIEFAGQANEKFGHLKGAINIPIQELEGRLAELDGAKNKPIIVYCSHNHRSPQASQLLTEKGFKNVTNMTGGMSVWDDSVGHLPEAKALLIK